MTAAPGTFAGAVLAGGRARRYGGIDKGALPRGDGRSILAGLLEALRGAGVTDLAICANDAARYAPLGLPVLPDRPPGSGPLGGIAAAVAHFRPRAEATVVLACDLPGLTAAQIRVLLGAFAEAAARVVVAQTPDSRWHPLCAVVRNDILDDLAAAVGRGELGVGRLWRRLGAVAVPFDSERPFANVNTPEDLARWHQESQRPH